MNILWIADLSVSHHIGGAQRSNKILLDKGRFRRYNIVEFNFDSDPSLLHQEYDWIITTNILMIKQKLPWFNDWLCERPNHIRHEYDSHQYNSDEMRKKIFDSARLVIFISDLHRTKFIEEYGIRPSNTVAIANSIDGDQFYDRKEKREPYTLYVGINHAEKGTNRFIQEVAKNPDKKYLAAVVNDKSRTFDQLPNLSIVRDVSYENMPVLYNKCTTFYFHPTGARPLYIEPFCRTVAEAIMCGMELDVSDNIGSYRLYKQVGLEKFRKKCTECADDFWDIVENVK